MTKCLSIIILTLILETALWAQPKIIAHRGASAEAPENTLSAFAKAMPMDVYALEFDVHLTQDGVPIVTHDFVFGRTTDGGCLQRTTELTFDQVRTLDAGAWFNNLYAGEPIPSLDEVLLLAQYQSRLMVEIKKHNSPPDVIAQTVVDHLTQTPGDYIVGSFSPEIIVALQNLSIQYPLIGIVEEIEMLQSFLDIGVSHIAIWFALLSPSLIEDLHAHGIEVWTFTVDNPSLAMYLDTIGIDGIISNNPRRLLEAFSSS